LLNEIEAWAGLALPAAAVGGVVCSALASGYVRRIEADEPVDPETLWAAWFDLVKHPRASWRPTGQAVLCVVLLLVASLPFVLHPSVLAFARTVCCAVLLLLALIDARCGLLPDALTLPLLWAGLLLAWAGYGPGLHEAVSAAALGYLFLWALNAAFMVLRGRSGLGGGDMKLVAALGAWLGWAPLPAVLLAACVAGIAFSLVAAGRQALGHALAFGPFLSFAGAVGLSAMPVVQFLF